MSSDRHALEVVRKRAAYELGYLDGFLGLPVMYQENEVGVDPHYLSGHVEGEVVRRKEPASQPGTPSYATSVQGVVCPACNAQPNQPCSTATSTGRKIVTWMHLGRIDAFNEARA